MAQFTKDFKRDFRDMQVVRERRMWSMARRQGGQDYGGEDREVKSYLKGRKLVEMRGN